MNSQNKNAQRLINHLVDLASAIDGVVDMGTTVCLLSDDRMAGRHNFIRQRLADVRLLVDAILDEIKEQNDANGHQAVAASELRMGCAEFLAAFETLEFFHELDMKMMVTTCQAFQKGWQTIHQAIRHVADGYGVFDITWYSPILQRDDYCRNLLRQQSAFFQNEMANRRPAQKS